MLASCGKVDPVFRAERCAASDKEHRMDRFRHPQVEEDVK
jgi:hypothetical protein